MLNMVRASLSTSGSTSTWRGLPSWCSGSLCSTSQVNSSIVVSSQCVATSLLTIALQCEQGDSVSLGSITSSLPGGTAAQSS